MKWDKGTFDFPGPASEIMKQSLHREYLHFSEANSESQVSYCLENLLKSFQRPKQVVDTLSISPFQVMLWWPRMWKQSQFSVKHVLEKQAMKKNELTLPKNVSCQSSFFCWKLKHSGQWLWATNIYCSWKLVFILGMTPEKKLADLRTLSQLSLPPLPRSPIRTHFNWDIFEHHYPSPPFLQLGQ